MFLKTITKRFKRFIASDKQLIGRWNIAENREIKEIMANMDSCGATDCGTPSLFSKQITIVLRNNKI